MGARGKDGRAKLFAIVLCGLLTGVVMAAAAFPVVAVTGLTAKSASTAGASRRHRSTSHRGGKVGSALARSRSASMR